MGDRADHAPLIPPPITDPNEIDLEAGPGEQIQCRICLETDGKNSFVLSQSLLRFCKLTSFLGINYYYFLKFPFWKWIVHFQVVIDRLKISWFVDVMSVILW